MNLMRIKWENIFGIITFVVLGIMVIEWIKQNGFNLDVIMFDLIYVSMSIITVMWCVKQTRKLYLNK